MTEWNREAERLAVWAGEDLFEAQRGAMPTDRAGVFLVFGNDGWCPSDESGMNFDTRSQREVAHFRQYLKEEGAEELGFAVEAEGQFTWAMLVRCPPGRSDPCPALNAAIWQAWDKACRREAAHAPWRFHLGDAVQVAGTPGSIARQKIQDHAPVRLQG